MNAPESENPEISLETDLTALPPVPNKYPFLDLPREADEIGRIDQYRILRLLGVGGMGIVFEAEEMTLHRRVALKVLRAEEANELESRERFLREARAAAAIHSDHVVTIYQIVDGAPPYLVMQYLKGRSLQELIEQPNTITLRSALIIARQTAEGLAAAHAVGLIHRDIKPANLWLESVGADQDANVPESSPRLGRVKILDFGLARRTKGETSLTSTGFIVGTPNYMSPEQASGGEIDTRADLFSLGCVVYTMLTGELPFPGSSAMAVMMALASRRPLSANTINPRIPKEAANLVDRLLEKDPKKRPQSAREVVTEVDRLLAALTDSPSLQLALPASSKTPLATPSVTETARTDANRIPSQATQETPTPDSPVSRTLRLRSPVLWITLSLTLVLGGLFIWSAVRKPRTDSDRGSAPPPGVQEPIVIGVLHSQSGRLASIEKPIVDSTLYAIEELNAAGGVLGRQLKVVQEDGRSNPDEFARMAEKLLTADKAVAIFGCYTGTSRRTVRSIIERNGGVLFFPGQTEGLEESPHIVYLGPSPNQHVIPAVDFLTNTLHKRRIAVAGSDSVFPWAVAQIVQDHLKSKQNAQFIAEQFLPVASDETVPLVRQIMWAKPDAIVNTIYGPANSSFFVNLRKDDLGPDQTAIVSVNISQNEVKAMNPPNLAGSYLAASYFQLLDRAGGESFAQKMKQRYGRDTTVNDSMAAAYDGVKLWAKTVMQIGVTSPKEVLKGIRGQEYEGPRGLVKIDPDNLHAWLPARIARIHPDGELELVNGPGLNERMAPIPYPTTRTADGWDAFVSGLNLKWFGKWQTQPPESAPKK